MEVKISYNQLFAHAHLYAFIVRIASVMLIHDLIHARMWNDAVMLLMRKESLHRQVWQMLVVFNVSISQHFKLAYAISLNNLWFFLRAKITHTHIHPHWWKKMLWICSSHRQQQNWVCYAWHIRCAASIFSSFLHASVVLPKIFATRRCGRVNVHKQTIPKPSTIYSHYATLHLFVIIILWLLLSECEWMRLGKREIHAHWNQPTSFICCTKNGEYFHSFEWFMKQSEKKIFMIEVCESGSHHRRWMIQHRNALCSDYVSNESPLIMLYTLCVCAVFFCLAGSNERKQSKTQF